ncbi:MAG TPA: type II secretion system F family protein [Acidimicrobiia bacterium]|nr:type II secretion system F family protein [Acidimicrobiia bacterium]
MIALVVICVGMLAAVELGRAARRADSAGRAHDLAPASKRLLPFSIRVRLADALAAADLAVTPEDAVRLWLSSLAGAALVGAALAPALGLVVGVAIGLGAPAALAAARVRRDRRLVNALPGLLDSVAAELRGGGTVTGALVRSGGGRGSLGSDMAALCARTDLGQTPVDALGDWANERPLPGVAECAGALAIAFTTGGRAAVALVNLAAALRERAGAVDEARALSAQTRASAVVIGVAPIAYLMFSSIVDPGSVGALVGTPIGWSCLVGGLALDAVAMAWMRRILRSPG